MEGSDCIIQRRFLLEERDGHKWLLEDCEEVAASIMVMRSVADVVGIGQCLGENLIVLLVRFAFVFGIEQS